MQNKILNPLNLEDNTSWNVATPATWTLAVFSEWGTLKQKDDAWVIIDLTAWWGNPLAILSDITWITWADPIANAVSLTLVEYEAITPDTNTLYNITDDAEAIWWWNTANEYTKTQNFNATILTDWTNISWDLESNQVCKVTLAWNRTLDNPTNMVDWATYILRVIQDSTWSRTLAYWTAYKFPWGTAPILTVDINAVDFLTFISDWTSMFGVSQLNFS